MNTRRLVSASIVCALLVASVAAWIAWSGLRSLDSPLGLTKAVTFKLAPGSRFSRVAQRLGAQGILPRPWALIAYARWTGAAAAIKAGEYEIAPGTTPRQLLGKLVSGQVVLHSFTIVDGWRVADLLAALERDPDILATPTVRSGGLAEGQYLPETYRFASGTPDLDILRQAHAALTRELDADWADRDPTLPLKNAEELLVMASIVEKESGLPEELGKIAGLYLHRLQIGMRLQADPTVIYGLGDTYDGDLHAVDLRSDGPYNTYTRGGLPPTPISLPSAAVIRATARPEKTDALYFVASGKGDGSHVFSATLQQHNLAVADYVTRHRQHALGPR